MNLTWTNCLVSLVSTRNRKIKYIKEKQKNKTVNAQ